ncbi:peroxidase 4 [Artemisia annua]|uniref:Peroxidase n=1 Tax=Artemisia annua TaxID=35608 RepID=A0A2U1PUU7_ARTAN|nr:peroxidase 4 [Artemisia annua]
MGSSVIVKFAFVMFLVGVSSAQLSTNFYAKSCPNLFLAVNSAVRSAISRETRMGASLLRLHFHDCFVNGCDGSILLDDTSSFTGEKNAAPNFRSARGFDVVDNIKSAVERACPGVVSCADILAITARDSVHILGGPYWNVKLGRRDSRTASQAAANNSIPPPTSSLSALISSFSRVGLSAKDMVALRDSRTASQAAANNSIPPPTSSLSALISSFSRVGLSAKDMVALSGSHTIGQARCTTFRARIYNETNNLDASFGASRRSNCPRASGSGDNNLAPLDVQTPNAFNNDYYKNLIAKKGLLHSDQQLFNGGSADSTVRQYSSNPRQFSSDFAAAMIKMGDFRPLTGSSGEIRRNCRRPN